MVVLSQESCDQIVQHLDSITKHVEQHCNNIDNAIKVFNEHPVVQSFYASGGFGKGMEAKLEMVKDSVRRYYGIISNENGLIPFTREIVKNQLELINKSSN